MVGVSPSSRSTSDDDDFLLPEFNELVLKDFELTVKDAESNASTPTPRRTDTKEDNTSMEQDISQLKNLVFALRERERNLQLQLVECYGMQGREAALRDLESQLKIINLEAKLFGLKIESLQSENQRLKAQVLVHSRVRSELEDADVKNKVLKRRIKLDGEQTRENISVHHQMIGLFQDREQKHGRDALEMERKMTRLKELEEENGCLGRRISCLVQENLELKRKLDSAQKIANSIIEYQKAEELEEVQNLKQSNDKLLMEIEKLRLNHSSDVEELVYLRWVNACLRYELRNYQPPQGKTVARDLSKCLSPRSEEKAKQLILEYSNSHADANAMNPIVLDDHSSSSNVSTGESDIAFMEISSTLKHSSNKIKFFSKLKKLILGKDHHHCNRVFSVDKTPTTCNSDHRVSFSNSSVEDIFGRDSNDSFSSTTVEEISLADQTPAIELRSSVDLQRPRRTSLEVVEGEGEAYSSERDSSYSHKRTGSEEVVPPLRSAHSRSASNEENDMAEKIELRKYAEVLKGSIGTKTVIRKSTSFS
ncbi:Protein CHUP1, chloroplastic [Dendrobium catenatum]|uniref:Protein CHUP1, chloroplastic n=2 Tax=Dendrobium catenatum TaxID=906689 RepID=A0A2I0WPX8_9ASPA|nr:Protein CHUP1, chloroplastic [Dendrobium catenatum]